MQCVMFIAGTLSYMPPWSLPVVFWIVNLFHFMQFQTGFEERFIWQCQFNEVLINSKNVDTNLFVISQNLVCAWCNLCDRNLTTER